MPIPAPTATSFNESAEEAELGHEPAVDETVGIVEAPWLVALAKAARPNKMVPVSMVKEASP
jgi:hypothetical protein